MFYKNKEDTIVALSTALGVGSIAIVRISGPLGLSIINKLVKKKINEQDSHKVFYRVLHSLKNGNSIIDQIMVTFFRAPNSYTGQDLVEISCHCNPLIVNNIIEEILSQGARIAEPGEFTWQAFMNNKIDLSQAEAVSDVIHSRTQQGLNQSIRHLEGKLSQKINEIKDEILGYLSLMEINLDFSDEEIEAIPFSQLKAKIFETIQNLKRLESTFDYGRLIQNGIRLLITGKPNVGKSSLLNLLLGKERAIVSNIPGTTRDYIEENMVIDGIAVNAVDTAGIRDTDDPIEEMGVERTIKQIHMSDIVLCMFEAHSELVEDDIKLLDLIDNYIPGNNAIFLLNKIDLGINQKTLETLSKQEYPIVQTSTTENQGIKTLLKEIKTLLLKDQSLETEEIVITSSRHRDIIKKTIKHLEDSFETIKINVSEEIVAIDLRLSLEKLGEITGETSTEDILNHVFSNFCIGK